MALTRVVIGDRSISLEVVLREMGPTDTPSEGDLGVNAALLGADFAGRNDTLWIAREAWGGFLADLQKLERTRRGEARVTAMSPDEFQLAVFATDSAGHLAAEGWIGRDVGGRNGRLRNRACFTLDIDPGTLSTLVRECEALTRVR